MPGRGGGIPGKKKKKGELTLSGIAKSLWTKIMQNLSQKLSTKCRGSGLRERETGRSIAPVDSSRQEGRRCIRTRKLLSRLGKPQEPVYCSLSTFKVKKRKASLKIYPTGISKSKTRDYSAKQKKSQHTITYLETMQHKFKH